MTTTHTSNAFTSYSPFFSSGLLAPQALRPQPRRLESLDTFNSDISEPWDDSVDSPSSPMALPDDSVMDVDMSELMTGVSSNIRRSTTPTPQPNSEEQTTPVPSPQQVKVSAPPTPADARPRLRRRRSSLTQGASPMNSIRSPARSAGNAFHLQMQLPAASRSRSGSVGGENMGLYGGIGMSIASQGTSLMGRMRSGSCSSANPQALGSIAPVSFRPRRLARRVHTVPIPAPAPPPTAPLPALPPFPGGNSSSAHEKLRPANMNLVSQVQDPVTTMKKSPTLSSARARGLSVSSSALDGEENRIDE